MMMMKIGCFVASKSVIPSSCNSKCLSLIVPADNVRCRKIASALVPQPNTSSLTFTTTLGPNPLIGIGIGIGIKRVSQSVRCFAALTPELKSTLDKVVTSHKVILFMKGTKEFPQCGFSNTVVQILKSMNVPFETMNILENEMLRQGLKEYSSWPTFPQLYIDGEFFGGCDITVEAYKNGQLQELLEKAMCS